MKKEYFWSLRSISTTCSEDLVCLEILLSTQRKQPENTSNSQICLFSWVACYVCNWNLVYICLGTFCYVSQLGYISHVFGHVNVSVVYTNVQINATHYGQVSFISGLNILISTLIISTKSVCYATNLFLFSTFCSSFGKHTWDSLLIERQ